MREIVAYECEICRFISHYKEQISLCEKKGKANKFTEGNLVKVQFTTIISSGNIDHPKYIYEEGHVVEVIFERGTHSPFYKVKFYDEKAIRDFVGKQKFMGVEYDPVNVRFPEFALRMA